MSQELLTQICEKMPDELTPFVIHYLTTQYGKDAPSSCSLVWGKRKVQPTYEGLHAYLEELGFQSRMEAVVVRSIVEQPEDIVEAVSLCILNDRHKRAKIATQSVLAVAQRPIFG